MTRRAIEDDLRATFASRVAAPPHNPALAETVLRRGRRARRQRRIGGAAAAVAVLLAGAAVTTVDLPDRAPTVAADLTGPPRVPLFTAQEPTTLTAWTDGVQAERPLGEATPVVVRADGTVVVTLAGNRPALALLPADDPALRPVVDDLDTSVVAVHASGDRVVVVTGRAERRFLEELVLDTRQVLRVVPLGGLVGPDEPVLPVAYSGDDVVLTLGEGERQRSARWEPGRDGVIGTLEGYADALGGASGRAAFRVTDDDRCRTEVVALTTGGRSWWLCRERFAGFSPDGRYVLAANAVGDGLVVRDADDGDLVREIDVPTYARAYGWETSSTTLHTTVDGDRTVVVRCDVARDACREVARFDDLGRIPQPVPPLRP